MSKPLKPEILSMRLENWARTLVAEIFVSLELEDGSLARESLLVLKTQVSANGHDWSDPANHSSGFGAVDIPLGYLAESSEIHLKAWVEYGEEIGDIEVRKIFSPRRFITGRAPSGMALRPVRHPERGPIQSAAMLEEFRAFAATIAASHSRVEALEAQFEAWKLSNLSKIAEIREALGRLETKR